MVGDSGVVGCATCHQQLAKFSWRLRVAIASHPKTPNPEVPLALFDGIRRWLGFLLGFMYLYLLFLLISPGVSWHHSALEKGLASTRIVLDGFPQDSSHKCWWVMTALHGKRSRAEQCIEAASICLYFLGAVEERGTLAGSGLSPSRAEPIPGRLTRTGRVQGLRGS